MAEAELRRLISEAQPGPERSVVTVAVLGERYREHLVTLGRKTATVQSVESAQRVWLDPQLGDLTLDQVTPERVEDLMRTMLTARLSAKSIRNYIGTLGAMYRFATHARRRWATTNPCDAVDLPPRQGSDEIRFLTTLEVATLTDCARPGPHQELDRALYLTAAMTGLRQGELIALRWRDVDWAAQRIRVRRSHVRGEFTTPKSRRSSRSVPLPRKVGAELDALSRSTRYAGDDDLVFAEPATGGVLIRGQLLRRYRHALKAARLETAHRFHDLRHTFGTAMAGAGVPMRTLQEWMGHRDLATTQLYADYSPNAREAEMVEAAFADPEPSRDTLTTGP